MTIENKTGKQNPGKKAGEGKEKKEGVKGKRERKGKNMVDTKTARNSEKEQKERQGKLIN